MNHLPLVGGVITLTERGNRNTVKPTGRHTIDVSEPETERLGRRLFEYQESILPEGETWEGLSEGDRGFWIDSAMRVVWELERIRGQSHNRDS